MKRKSGRKSKTQDEDESNGIDQNGSESDLEESPKKKKSSASPRKTKKDDASSVESAGGDSEDSEKEEKNSKKNDPVEDPLASAEKDESASEGKKSKRSRKPTQKESNDSKDGDEEDEKQNENKKSKKGKKPAQKESNEDVQDEEDESQYEVEKVLDEKMVRGVRHYLIRWKGYEEESDTWEPENTLSCSELINAFKEQKKNKKPGKNSKPKKKDESDNAEDCDESEDVEVKEQKKNKKPGKTSKPKKKDESENAEDWDESEDFEVERILDVYFKRDGKKEFLVSWKGYSSVDNSWEPEEHMSCKDLINKFMAKVEKARQVDERELRIKRQPVQRFTLSTQERARRLSKRLTKKERVQYHDAE